MLGLIMDTVTGVHDIPSADVKPPPAVTNDADTICILGMGKVGNDVNILPDIDRILTCQNPVVLRRPGMRQPGSSGRGNRAHGYRR